jgi:MOSC domain-containing protein YiiM
VGIIVQLSASSGGLPKLPVLGGLITFEGLSGDRHAHPEFHGGPNQAILLIAAETIDALQLAGFPVFYGALGENLTTRGLDTHSLQIGDKLRAGASLLQITKPRGPCAQLNVYGPEIHAAIYDARVKARDSSSPLWSVSGLYAKVLEEGEVNPNDPIALIEP